MKQILILLCLMAGISAKAQSLTPEVFSAFGGDSNANGIQLSFTGGESIVSTIESINSSLSQGFMQVVKIEQATGINPIEQNSKIKVFPNPVSDELRINSDELRVLGVVAADVSGRVVYQSQPKTSSPRLSVSSWHTGVYFISITTEQGTSTYKVFKK